MAFEVTWLSESSTLIVTLSGEFDPRTILAVIASADCVGSEYRINNATRIIDAQCADPAMSSAILQLIEALRCPPTPNIIHPTPLFVVGPPALLEIIHFAGMPICVFTSLDDALACVQQS